MYSQEARHYLVLRLNLGLMENYAKEKRQLGMVRWWIRDAKLRPARLPGAECTRMAGMLSFLWRKWAWVSPCSTHRLLQAPGSSLQLPTQLVPTRLAGHGVIRPLCKPWT